MDASCTRIEQSQAGALFGGQDAARLVCVRWMVFTQACKQILKAFFGIRWWWIVDVCALSSLLHHHFDHPFLSRSLCSIAPSKRFRLEKKRWLSITSSCKIARKTSKATCRLKKTSLRLGAHRSAFSNLPRTIWWPVGAANGAVWQFLLSNALSWTTPDCFRGQLLEITERFRCFQLETFKFSQGTWYPELV